MTLYRCFDAAFPPATAPPGCSAVLGYIGRNGYTPHVWTLPEWDRFAHLIQFPAYVPDPSENPKAAAVRATQAMRDLGWAPWQDARRVVVFDLETLILPAWYQQAAAEVAQQGYAACAYGSESTILANAAADVWLAAWNGNPVLEPGQTIHAHQYANAGPFDVSVVDDWLFARGGQGPRHT